MKKQKIEYRCFVVGELEVNAYVVYAEGSGTCFVIDPGDDEPRLVDFMRKHKLSPAGIILTHGHLDHCGGVQGVMNEFKVPLMVHRDDAGMLRSKFNKGIAGQLNLALPPEADRLLVDGDVLETGGVRLEVLHTPGHSPGSICLRVGEILFSGDTLFAGGVGRTDLEGGDFSLLKQSLARIVAFPPGTVVLPGHGDSSTVAREKRLNPFL